MTRTLRIVALDVGYSTGVCLGVVRILERDPLVIDSQNLTIEYLVTFDTHPSKIESLGSALVRKIDLLVPDAIVVEWPLLDQKVSGKLKKGLKLVTSSVDRFIHMSNVGEFDSVFPGVWKNSPSFFWKYQKYLKEPRTSFTPHESDAARIFHWYAHSQFLKSKV